MIGREYRVKRENSGLVYGRDKVGTHEDVIKKFTSSRVRGSRVGSVMLRDAVAKAMFDYCFVGSFWIIPNRFVEVADRDYCMVVFAKFG